MVLHKPAFSLKICVKNPTLSTLFYKIHDIIIKVMKNDNKNKRKRL